MVNDCLSLNLTISKHAVAGSIIVRDFSMRGSSLPSFLT